MKKQITPPPRQFLPACVRFWLLRLSLTEFRPVRRLWGGLWERYKAGLTWQPWKPVKELTPMGLLHLSFLQYEQETWEE